MRLKKVWAVVAVLALVVAVCAACAPQEKAVWSIAIEGAEKTEFTSVDYAKLDTVTIDVVQVNKEGVETPQKWKGVLLKDVAKAIGAGDYASLTVEASDGYAKDYTPDIVGDELTILGTVKDGETLTEEDGFVQTVAGSQTSNMWIKMIGKITVNK